MIVALTFGAGLQVNREHLIAILKDGWLLARAVLANFVLVPAFGVLLANAFALPGPIKTGFLLMAIAPGVPLVLSSVRKRGGSLGLAVALEFLLPLFSIVTVPITAALVLPQAAEAHLPFGRFFATLVLFQLLPLLLGMVVGERAPRFAAKLVRPAQIVFYVALLSLLGLLGPRIAHDVAVVYGSRGMLAMLSLVLLSLFTGWLLGGPVPAQRRILAIGTALRNIGLAVLIATTAFPKMEVAASVLTYLLIQAVVVTATGIYFARTSKDAAA
ncbi:MAG: bile acid:sodium symporter [Candidatus Baltobacteraceae bacterium]